MYKCIYIYIYIYISKSPAGNPATVPDQDQVQDREADQDPHPEKEEEKQTGEREVRKRRKKGARKRQRKRKREREREREEGKEKEEEEEKRSPRLSKNFQNGVQSHPGRSKKSRFLEKVKTFQNHCIYHGLATCSLCDEVAFLKKIVKKTRPESSPQLLHKKIQKVTHVVPKWFPRGAKSHPVDNSCRLSFFD